MNSPFDMRAAEHPDTDFSDEKLFELCQKYGRQTLLWRQKFLGLLPEVNRRRLFEKKGFESIFVFAKKLAGVSEEQVRLVLNLERRFVDKPVLHDMLVAGRVSVHKLARVASIATVENEADVAESVARLPQKAVETLVRDFKIENGLFDHQNEAKSLRAQTSIAGETLELSEEVQQKLLELKQKGIDVNTLILKAIEEREVRIAQEKERLSMNAQPTTSRYIPIKTRKIIQEEHGNKCSIKYCSKPSKVLHHSQRFALAKIHDPKYLAPLCKEHHAVAHLIDQKFQKRLYASQSP